MNRYQDSDLESVATVIESTGSFFIPGITARARCLSTRHNSSPLLLDHRLGLQRASLNDDGDDNSGSTEQRSSKDSASDERLQEDRSGTAPKATSTYRPRRRKLHRVGSRKDPKFVKMLEDLTASREAADAVRETAVRVKQKYEKEGSDRSLRHSEAKRRGPK